MKYLKYIQYVNFFKLLNIIKLQLFYIYKKNHIFDKINLPDPYFLAIEPTNFCNLKCVACPTGTENSTRKQGYINFDLFKKIIDEQRKTLVNLILHFQGEPLLHKHLGEMIEYAHKNKIYTMLSTNAQLISKNFNPKIYKNLDKIIISLDGLTQETYSKYRINGSVQKVFDTLKLLSSLKQKPFIELQFLVFNHNYHEISELKKIKKEYKIDKIRLKTVQIYNSSQIELLPKDEKYSRYHIDNNIIKVKSRLSDKCKRVIFGSVITWEGNVIPCCFDKSTDFITGNINNDNLKDIRNSNKTKKFINKVFTERKSIHICKNCTEGLKD